MNKEKIVKFIKGTTVFQYDLDCHYSNSSYNRALDLAKQNINVQGVSPLQTVLKSTRADYVAQMEQFINKERETGNRLFARLHKTNLIKNICKWAFLASLIILIISFFTQLFSNSLDIVIMPVFLLSLLGLIVFKPAEMIFDKQYNNYKKNVQSQFDNFNYQFNTKVKNIYSDIDNCYLASLDPAHREIVLMKRQMSQQNQELLHQQEQAFEQQKRLEMRLLEEQRRSRSIQEHLLEIEKDREKRYRGSR